MPRPIALRWGDLQRRGWRERPGEFGRGVELRNERIGWRCNGSNFAAAVRQAERAEREAKRLLEVWLRSQEHDDGGGI